MAKCVDPPVGTSSGGLFGKRILEVSNFPPKKPKTGSRGILVGLSPDSSLLQSPFSLANTHSCLVKHVHYTFIKSPLWVCGPPWIWIYPKIGHPSNPCCAKNGILPPLCVWSIFRCSSPQNVCFLNWGNMGEPGLPWGFLGQRTPPSPRRRCSEVRWFAPRVAAESPSKKWWI